MSITLLKDVDLVEEAYNLLKYMANVNKSSMMGKEYLDKSIESQALYLKKTKLMEAIYEDVKSKLQLDPDKINYYFKSRMGKDAREDDLVEYAAFVLLRDSHTYYLDIEEVACSARALSQKEKYSRFVQTIQNEGEVEIESEEEVIKCLETSLYTDESCWQILNILHHHEEHLEKVIQMLRMVIQLLKQNMDKIQALEELFYEMWKKYEHGDLLIRWLEQITGFKWSCNPFNLTLLPCIFLRSTVTMYISKNQTKPDVIRIGLQVDDILNQRPKMDEAHIIKFNKLISDTSKLEILRFLKDKEAYGKEIADNLDLKSATISYHMSTLIDLQLVKTAIRANKVYYTINRKQVEKYIEALKYYLLNEK